MGDVVGSWSSDQWCGLKDGRRAVVEGDSPKTIDGVAGADVECLAVFGQDDVGCSEGGGVAVVAKLADRKEGVVGHFWEDVGASGMGGEGGKDAVSGKESSMSGGHGVAIG